MISKKLKLFMSVCVVVLSPHSFAVTSSPSAECATGISNLLKLVARNKFFDESPEKFLSKSATFLHIAKNETGPNNESPERYARITLKKESWLDRGNLFYDSNDNLSTRLSIADFRINQSCSPKQKDFLTLATKNIKGKFAVRESSEDESALIRVWTMPDPEDNMQRDIEVGEFSDNLYIKVIRTPITEEGGGE